jgi:hypothetical protein
VAWPAFDPDPSDGLPVSDYPMFATARPSVTTFRTAVAVDHDGLDVRLGPGDVAGTDEVILAVETVRLAVDGGGAAATRLCREIAARLDGNRFARVELRSEEHDLVAWYEDDARQPRSTRVHARCPVP